MSQLTLESQSEQTNVRVLSPAIEPSEPSRPNIPRFIAMSLAAGILAGFLAAIGVEFLDRRVRNVADIVIEGVPVLGVMAPQREKYTVRQRIQILRAFLASHRHRREVRRQAARLRGKAAAPAGGDLR